MVYNKQTWENNPPSTATPITAERLDHLETQYDEAIATLEPTVSELSDTVNTGRLSEAELTATFAAREAIDLASFLLPGEVMPNDGVADARPLFQRALDAVAASVPTTGPVTIRIPSGRFKILSAVRWFTGYHVGFIGAGRENTRILPEGSAVFGLMDPSFDDTTTLDGLQFADFTIDCSAQDGPLDQVGIKGIALRWLVDSRFDRVRILNSWATSFGCDFLRNVTFADCTAIGSGRGVLSQHSFGAGFGIGTGAFENETVRFESCYASGARSSGFFIENLISTPNGVRGEGAGFIMTGCVAIGNWNGLRDFGAESSVITGCQFIDNENAGINIDGGTQAGRHGGRNNLASSNIIRGNGVGVLIGDAAVGTYTFTDNEIVENTGAGCQATSRLGDGWVWRDNRITGNGAGGIILSSPLIVLAQIVGNVIRENGVGDGVLMLGDVVEPVISDNTISGHRGAGIRLPNAASFMTEPTIQGNNLSENSLGGLVNEKATDDTARITGNRASASFATITNLNTHPSFEDGTVGPVTAITRFDAPVPMSDEDRGYVRLTATGNSPTARVMRVTAPLSGSFTASVWVRATRDTRIRAAVSGKWNSDAESRNWQRGGVEATGDWQRVRVTFPLPSNGSGVDLTLSIDNAVAGNTLDVRDVMLTDGVTLWEYFDGDSVGAEWSGTDNASTSVLTLSEVPIDLEAALFAITGQSPFVQQEGSGTAAGLSDSAAQPMTIYGVFSSAPSSVRARLRSATNPSIDRLSVGRNSAGNAWVAVTADTTGATKLAAVNATAGPGVVAGVREETSITVDVHGLSSTTTTIDGFDTVTLANLNNDAAVVHSLAYLGAHDASTRADVMDVLATVYGIS